MTPHVSIIIASGAGGEFLFRCLASLENQARSEGAEILVIDRVGGEHVARVEREYPDVRILHADQANLDGKERASIPELRRMGLDEASAPIIAILEEHCTAPPHWLSTIKASFAANSEAAPTAIGGPILHADFTRIRDWVVYFSEYHNYLPPWADGERYVLNGANIAYPREALMRHRDVLDTGYWEVVLHPLLAADGKLLAVNAMGAHHAGPFDYGYYLEQRYLLSRQWTGTQKDKVGLGKRLFYLIFAPLFPLLLLARITSRVIPSEVPLGRLVVAFPLLLPVVFAYVWGEWLGYLLGPGDALERVE